MDYRGLGSLSWLSLWAFSASWHAFLASDSDRVLSPARSRAMQSFITRCLEDEESLLEVVVVVEVVVD
jgi:hypothetical protein